MRYGVSYYPEHKDRDELQHDLELLKSSGINTVRMGEFAWCRMEPSEGHFDFEWLETAVNELGKAGISTILCTPTACPPAWLIEKHPDILYTDNRRMIRPFGGRRHYCYNNEKYRLYSKKIAEKMAQKFADNPYICGVQIDNEPAQEGTGRCCCQVCSDRFRKWLADKYGSVKIFNKRSGSVFWSQEYDSFDQIQIPVNSIETGAQQAIAAYYENPSIRLEFERFCSESQIQYQNIQAEVIRRYMKVPVTTNATGLATNSIDYYESTKKLDRYAFDYYPGLRKAAVDSFPYAFARGVKKGEPFWILEFMSGGGHRLGGSGRLQPDPGALKQAVIQSLAHGSELMLHFQFRTFPFGAEQLNYAIVDMDGVPRRRYFEMQDTAQTLKLLEPLEKASFPKETAVCFDYDSLWALKIKPVNDPVFNYVDYCGKIYHMLEKIGVTSDVISLKDEWSGYKAVIIPAAIVMDRKTQNKVRHFVDNGGTVIATFLTSVKNEDNVGYTETLPCGLTDVFGCTVEEVEPVFDNCTAVRLKRESSEAWCHMDETEDNVIETEDGLWSELLGGCSEAIGSYTADYKEGMKVISACSYGKGRAYYIGTDIPEKDYCELLKGIIKEAGVRYKDLVREEKVEMVSRYDDEHEYICLFNFTGHSTEVILDGNYTDLITEKTVHTKCSIPANGSVVLSRKNKFLY